MPPETPDDKPINLFPQDVLQKIADAGTPPPAPHLVGGGGTLTIPGPFKSHTLTLPGPLELPPVSEDEQAKNRLLALGPTYDAVTMPPSDQNSTFMDHLVGEAELSLLPAALVAQAAKPVIDFAYGLIDRIPAPIRQPFEKAFGMLIDNALSYLGQAANPLVDQSVQKFFPNGQNLPASAGIPIKAYSQIWNSCGDTAVAEILKSDGIPVPVFGDIDAQAVNTGTSFAMEADVKRRGLTVLNGPSDMTGLKAFLATGYPVMVSVGWAKGGGHYAVVSGYDDSTKQLTIQSWDGRGGQDVKVDYSAFAADWARKGNQCTVVLPQQDPRLDALMKMGDPRRPTQISEGISLSNFWVSADGKIYIEAAYRYVGPSTDITVRLHWDQHEDGLARQLGGALAIRQRVADQWYVGLEIQKVSLLYQADDWTDVRKLPLSFYANLEGPGIQLKIGEEQGAIQASLAVDLGKWMAGLGLQANVSLDLDGNYKVMVMLAGTF